MMRIRLLLLLCLLGMVSAYAAASPVVLVWVNGRSMEPTFHPGQIVLARRTPAATPAADAAAVQVAPGDIVVVRHEGRNLVKRVAHAAGWRTLQAYNDEWVEVGVTGSMAQTAARLERAGFKTRTVEVPPGHVYLLGDNENFSEDSRHFGPVPLSDVTAVVMRPLL